MNLPTKFLKMYDTLINRKVFLACFLASKPNFYLWDFLSNHQLKQIIKPGNCPQYFYSLNIQTLINSKTHGGPLVQVMLSVEEDLSLIKHVHKQLGLQMRGFIWAPCTAQGTLPLGSHTKPLSHDCSAWIRVPIGTTCTSYSSSFSGSSTSRSAPASPITSA